MDHDKLDKSQELEFQALSWYATDIDIIDDESGDMRTEYMIKVFGCTHTGLTVSATIEGFKPFFYVKVPEKYSSSHCNTFMELLMKKAAVYKVEIVERKDLWGFSNDALFRFIKISFNSCKHMRFLHKELTTGIKIDKLFGIKKQIFKTYESNIDPYIRMLHLKNLDPSGWICLPAGSYTDNHDHLVSNCHIDVCVKKWRKIVAAECDESAPFLVASFDIECTNNTGDFPVPVKNYKRLASDIYELYMKHKDTMLDYHLKNAVGKAILYAFGSDEEFDHASLIHRVEPKHKVNLELVSDTWSAFADDAYTILTGKIKLENPTEKATREKIINILTTAFGYFDEKRKGWISSNKFPELHGDPVIQIGTTFHRYGDRECCHKQIFALGTCDPVEGAVTVSCKDETELLLKWRDHIVKMNPDIITGYNIFGFDFVYLYERAKQLGLAREFMKISRLKDHKSEFKEVRLSSSALGDNFLKYIDMEGRVLIDLMKVVQRDHKLDSYKLDNVASHFLGMNKNDVTPNEIFALQRGSSADRSRIAAYCVQDCALCNHLVIKLEIIANNMGMSNVCCVPLSFIFMRGQGIKIFSLVLKQCSNEYLIPVIKPALSFGQKAEIDLDNPEESYEGAIVLEPKKGIYLDAPISVLDYASLYPSSMISENLSPDSIVLDPKYDNLPGVEYLDIEWTEGKTARFVQPAEGKKGVLPRILMKLLQARKSTRKRATWQSVIMNDGTEHRGFYDSATGSISLTCGSKLQLDTEQVKEVKDTYNSFQKAVLDGLQNAYKVTANSLYGQMGAKTSPIYLKEIAASTTATGRKMILMAKKYIEENYEGSEVVYGDSVTGDSPILLRFPDGHIEIKTIETLTDIWRSHEKFKVWDDVRYDKQQGFLEAETWTSNGWAKIRRVIRHKTNKKIYRITTLEGSVDVTEDHSLIDINGDPIKPNDCVSGPTGTELWHSFPSEFPDEAGVEEPYIITMIEAFVWGIFFGDGSCESSWIINNKDTELLQLTRENLKEDVDFIIQDSCKLVPKGSSDNLKVLQLKFRRLFYDKSNNKKVPTIILNAPREIRTWFLKGYTASDGSRGNLPKSDKNNGGICIGKVAAQGIYYLIRSLGWEHVSVIPVSIGENTYWIHGLKDSRFIDNNKNWIKSNHELYSVSESGSYVYDLETEDGTFLSGVGSITLKNTDSLFLRFKTADQMGNVLTGTDAIRKSRELGINASSSIKKLLKPPHDLEFEKIFSPFILLSKKRYVGNKYEMDDHKFKQNSMGIVLKRRDNANIVKKIYGGVIDIILNEKNIVKAVEFLKEQLNNLIDGKCQIEDLILSKSLRADYKDPTRIAHKVLAERIGERDPGNKPQTSDRIQFVYVQQEPTEKGKKMLQGERIETPQFIKDNNLKPDYNHYITNQIMKPLLQLFGIVVTQIPGYNKHPSFFEDMYSRILEDLKDEEKAHDKLQALKELEVKTILFDPILNRDLIKPKRTRKNKYDTTVVEDDKPKPRQKRITAKSVVSKIIANAEEPPLIPKPRIPKILKAT